MSPPAPTDASLQQQMARAISDERYEEAARLRDQLQALADARRPRPPPRSEFEELSVTSDTVTQGIRVTVTSTYVPSQSMPTMGQFFFAYSVKMCNESTRTVQLRNRHWRIRDLSGKEEHVRGPGVVGKQPLLEPGACYEYESACPLLSELGSMEGAFEFVNLDATGQAEGPPYAVAIGRFGLKRA